MNDVALTARPATQADARLLFEWRNDDDTRAASRSSEVVRWDEHVDWLSRTLSSDDSLLVVVEGGRPVGTVRWDRLDSRSWELSITLAPSARGRGLGGAVLSAGESALSSRRPGRLVAVVRAENEAAQRLFRSAGYLPDGTAQDGLLVLAKDVRPD